MGILGWSIGGPQQSKRLQTYTNLAPPGQGGRNFGCRDAADPYGSAAAAYRNPADPYGSAGATYWAHMGPMVKPCRPQRVPMDPPVHPTGTPVDPYGSAGAIQSDPSRNICASWCNRLGRQCAHLGPLVQGVNHPFQKLLPHMEIAVSSKRNHPFQNVLLAQPAQARPGLGLTNLATATRTQL